MRSYVFCDIEFVPYCFQVFEDVVDILDPEMNLATDDEDSYEGDEDVATPSTPPAMRANGDTGKGEGKPSE